MTGRSQCCKIHTCPGSTVPRAHRVLCCPPCLHTASIRAAPHEACSKRSADCHTSPLLCALLPPACIHSPNQPPARPTTPLPAPPTPTPPPLPQPHPPSDCCSMAAASSRRPCCHRTSARCCSVLEVSEWAGPSTSSFTLSACMGIRGRVGCGGLGGGIMMTSDELPVCGKCLLNVVACKRPNDVPQCTRLLSRGQLVLPPNLLGGGNVPSELEG